MCSSFSFIKALTQHRSDAANNSILELSSNQCELLFIRYFLYINAQNDFIFTIEENVVGSNPVNNSLNIYSISNVCVCHVLLTFAY